MLQCLVKALFAKGGNLAWTVINTPVSMLDNLAIKMTPIVKGASPYTASYSFNWLAATGTAILFAAVVTIVILRMKPGDAVKSFVELLKTIYSIGIVLSFSFIANYSELPERLALLLAGTGAAFPFFSLFLGCLMVCMTGSDRSSNALFCNLKATTVQQIGAHDTLMISANTTVASPAR